jgi:hypothetical protein
MLVSGRSLGQIQSAVERTAPHAVPRRVGRRLADCGSARSASTSWATSGNRARTTSARCRRPSTPSSSAGGPTDERIAPHAAPLPRRSCSCRTWTSTTSCCAASRSDLQRLENGDTVLVPPIGPHVTVTGAVRRPAVYELRGEQSLAGLPSHMAGGVLPTAALAAHRAAARRGARPKRTMFSLDLTDVASPVADAMAARLEAFPAARRRRGPHRRRSLPPRAIPSTSTGHVAAARAASAYRDGMRLGDRRRRRTRIVLPEPAVRYAEIVRLQGARLPAGGRELRSRRGARAARGLPAAAAARHGAHLQPLRLRGSRPPSRSAARCWSPGSFRSAGQIRVRDALAPGRRPRRRTRGSTSRRSSGSCPTAPLQGDERRPAWRRAGRRPAREPPARTARSSSSSTPIPPGSTPPPSRCAARSRPRTLRAGHRTCASRISSVSAAASRVSAFSESGPT